MTPKAWEAGGRYLSIDQHQIFIRQQGSGPCVVFLHGFPSSSWDWHMIWEDLLPHYRLVCLDFFGFGYSDKPRAGDYSIARQANIVERVLGTLEVDTFHLFSHDYGDTVAQELLARRSEGNLKGLRSVCFLNGGLFPETHQPLLIQQLLMSPIGCLIGKFLTQKKLQQSFERIFGPQTQPTASDIAHIWEQILHKSGTRVAHKLIRYMKERQQYRSRWVGALQHSEIPLRLIDGLKDPISGAQMVDRYKALVPNPDVVELPNIGHYPQLEAPKTVSQNYQDFLQRLNTFRKD
ncbi:MAG: alpha/beta fold hydrolase [Flavobacteriaceae bacterium]